MEWDNTIGGSGEDRLFDIKQTSDSGYILGGHSNSPISSDKSENPIGGTDYWIVKLNSAGIIEWENTIGGNQDEQVRSVEQTLDGGYIIGGRSESDISGDKTENSNGELDFWPVKLFASGEVEWDASIGGDSYDNGAGGGISQTMNGGYILGGESFSSISGDKTENPIGGLDYWVVKLEANLGVEETTLQTQLNVYPNPTLNLLNVSLQEITIKQLVVYNIHENVVFSKARIDTNNTTIPVAHLASGMYFVEVHTEDSVLTRKFIKR